MVLRATNNVGIFIIIVFYTVEILFCIWTSVWIRCINQMCVTLSLILLHHCSIDKQLHLVFYVRCSQTTNAEFLLLCCLFGKPTL